MNNKYKKIAVVSNCMPHYRIPIYNLLSSSKSNNYTIITGTKMNIQLKVADKILATIKPEEGGVRWIQVKNIWIFNRFLWQKGLLKELKKSNYDTIIMLGTVYYLSTWVAAILWRLRGKKIIFWTHAFIRDEKNILGFLRTMFYKLAHQFLVYGQRGKDIMVSKGFDPNKIKLVYNSLDYDNQIRIRRSNQDFTPIIHFKNSELPTIGYIGRILKQKKLDLLVEAVKNLHHHEIFCNAIIVGDGADIEELKSLVSSYKLNDFFYFYGPCYDENIVFKLLSQTCIIVSPGEVGLTAIHAMTYGLPIITHDKLDEQGPEYACIKADLTGDFFDYYNPIESLSTVLIKWFNKKDRIFTAEQCYNVIDKYYNPYKQKEIIDSIV